MPAAVIIPTYNHREQVMDVVRRSLLLDLPIFVVDDGSTDGTSAALAGMRGITVIRHSVNQGKGAALLTGFAAAASTCDWALTIDADGQHRPEDGRYLLAAAAAQGGERLIVVGCRQGMSGEHVPWTSRFGRLFSNFWVWAAGGPWIADSQSGFRLYPLPETMRMGARGRRYQFEVEILVLARRNGIRTVEAPIQVIYQPKGVRVSHFRPWLDFCRNSATFTRLICSRLFQSEPRR